MVPCPACGADFPQGELNDHMSRCRAASQRFGNGGTFSRPSGKLGLASGNNCSSSSCCGSGGAVNANAVNGNRQRPSKSMVIQPADADGRVPCARCGRRFAPDRIAKHQYICTGLKHGPARSPTQVAATARKAAAPMVLGRRRSLSSKAPPRGGGGGGQVPFRARSTWREASRDLRSAIRAARGIGYAPPSYSGGGSRGREGAYGGGRGGADRFEPCPHCGRTFAPAAWERHVDKCQNIVNKPRPPPGPGPSPGGAGRLRAPMVGGFAGGGGSLGGSSFGGGGDGAVGVPRRRTPLEASREAALAGLAREERAAVHTPRADGMLPAGQRVQIRGLQAKPELNGQSAAVTSYDREAGRYVVRTDMGNQVAIKPANLEVVIATHRPQSGGERATARAIAASMMPDLAARRSGGGHAAAPSGSRVTSGGARRQAPQSSQSSQGMQDQMNDIAFARGGSSAGNSAGGRRLPRRPGNAVQPPPPSVPPFSRASGREAKTGANPETRPMQTRPQQGRAAPAAQPSGRMSGGLMGGGGGYGGGGGIDPSNRTSTDNPLAGMVSYQSEYRGRR